jgi:hypothetical protein
MNIEQKIEKLIEEFMLVAGPGILPGIQSNFAREYAKNINAEKELKDFKKIYPNYKEYDDYTTEAKRGLKYGAMTSIPFGALMYANNEDGDAAEMTAGLTGMVMTSGATIPALSKGIDYLIGNKEKIRDIVQAKEKEFQKNKHKP